MLARLCRNEAWEQCRGCKSRRPGRAEAEGAACVEVRVGERRGEDLVPLRPVDAGVDEKDLRGTRREDTGEGENVRRG
jgi:hypothetical protein